MKTLKQIVGLAAAALMAVTALSACNTIEGMGKDIKSTGTAIEGAASDDKRN